jgi:hypothetical protein
MKLFGFGKKKDDNIDEYLIRKDLDNIDDVMKRRGRTKDDENIVDDNMKNNDQEDTNGIEEDISDYIDLDDLDCDDYENIVDTIEENGWYKVSGVACPITTLDTQIVFCKPAKANRCDTLLEIICPPERIITMCGLNECCVDLEGFYDKPNVYQIPHFFTLMCTDVNGVELLQTTLISILKSTKDGEIEKCYEEFYGDLSPIIGGKLKRKEERYHFATTVILQGGEKLIFKVNNPGMDISKVDLLMLSDIFEKDEE